MGQQIISLSLCHLWEAYKTRVVSRNKLKIHSIFNDNIETDNKKKFQHVLLTKESF